MIRCCHADDRGGVVGRRIGGERIGIRTVVPRCGHEEDPRGTAGIDRVEEILVESAAAPAVVRHSHVHAVHLAHHRGIVDGTNGIGRRSGAAGGEELEAHEGHVPADPHHARAVVAGCSDGAGHVRSVVVVVHRIAVVVHEVVSVHIVHEAVGVIVHAVTGDLARVGPDVAGQIDVGPIDSSVDDAHHDRATAGGAIPGFWGIDVGIDNAAGLPDVMEAVEPRILRVVRRGRHVHDGISCELRHSGLFAQIPLDVTDGSCCPHQHLPGQAEPLHNLQTQRHRTEKSRCLAHRRHPAQRRVRQSNNPLPGIVGLSVCGRTQ